MPNLIAAMQRISFELDVSLSPITSGQLERSLRSVVLMIRH